ncbi:hypothetical protein ABE64_06040, partial [Bacillus megaterium]|nr:hypothetical protein [Priestia megaterium]
VALAALLAVLLAALVVLLVALAALLAVLLAALVVLLVALAALLAVLNFSKYSSLLQKKPKNHECLRRFFPLIEGAHLEIY